MAVDPVCGMTVDPAKAAAKVEHGGETYHFCSPHCVKSFKADPAKYLAKSSPKSGAAAPPAGQYTCPMHPEILQDGPGSCPKCGMALVPVAGAGEEDNSELRDMTRRLWVGVAFSLPLFLLSMAPMICLLEPFFLSPRTRGWIELALGTPVVLC